MKFNTHDYVKVRLNDTGRRIYRDYYARMGRRMEPDVDAYGWTRLAFWQVMGIFGTQVAKGFDIPFDTNLELEIPPATAPYHAV